MRRLRSLVSWLLLAALVALAYWLERRPGEEIRAAGGEAVHVIDGDSLRLGGREIRLAGVDAPEYRQSCTDAGGKPWPCGKEARTALETLVGKGDLVCTTRIDDRYGRALGQCRAGGRDVGAELARQGWALGARDERFEEPQREMAEAKAARRGVWRGAHQHPADWRKAQPR
jgi:endonuclease YncB( thermonuclease family)